MQATPERNSLELANSYLAKSSAELTAFQRSSRGIAEEWVAKKEEAKKEEEGEAKGEDGQPGTAQKRRKVQETLDHVVK